MYVLSAAAVAQTHVCTYILSACGAMHVCPLPQVPFRRKSSRPNCPEASANSGVSDSFRCDSWWSIQSIDSASDVPCHLQDGQRWIREFCKRACLFARIIGVDMACLPNKKSRWGSSRLCMCVCSCWWFCKRNMRNCLLSAKR